MTELWFPQEGIELSANDVTAMWRKPTIRKLGGFSVTHTSNTFTVHKGKIQIDGTAMTLDRDVIFDIPYYSDITYFLFLVSNRTNEAVVKWADNEYLFYPNELTYYKGGEAVPAMSTRLCMGMKGDYSGKSIYDSLSFLQGFIYQTVNELYIEPLWSVRNLVEYYYPQGYDFVDVLHNVWKSKPEVLLNKQDFNQITFDGVAKASTPQNIVVTIAPINTTGLSESNIRLDGSDITGVAGSDTITIPALEGQTSCVIHGKLRKYREYLFVHITCSWPNGVVNVVTGQFFYGQYSYGLSSIAIGMETNTPKDGAVGSDIKVRVQ